MMNKEIDLLINYPKVKRDLQKRCQSKTAKEQFIARQFGKDFFDGDRKYGYGGYYYDPKFWQPVIPSFQNQYQLTPDSTVLDVGAGKGFMMYDFFQLIPGIEIKGIDISAYAIENAAPEMKPHLQIADARDLPFPDNSFDLVISINTLHNFEGPDLEKAFNEIGRVSRRDSYVTVDAYRNEEEKSKLYSWNLTAKTIMHVSEWTDFFKKVRYTGDYFWFVP